MYALSVGKDLDLGALAAEIVEEQVITGLLASNAAYAKSSVRLHPVLCSYRTSKRDNLRERLLVLEVLILGDVIGDAHGNVELVRIRIDIVVLPVLVQNPDAVLKVLLHPQRERSDTNKETKRTAGSMSSSSS